MLANDCRPDKDPVDVRLNCPLIEFCVGCRNVPLRIIMLTVTSLIAIFFVLPGTYLCHVHVKNFTSGKTTNERFSRAA